MLLTAVQFALAFSYAAIAAWSASNSALEHPKGRIELGEALIITIVSLFWILFYAAALAAIAIRSLIPAERNGRAQPRVLSATDPNLNAGATPPMIRHDPRPWRTGKAEWRLPQMPAYHPGSLSRRDLAL